MECKSVKFKILINNIYLYVLSQHQLHIFHRIFWVMALLYIDRVLEFGTNYNKKTPKNPSIFHLFSLV